MVSNKKGKAALKGNLVFGVTQIKMELFGYAGRAAQCRFSLY